jgi:hypothetical protein
MNNGGSAQREVRSIMAERLSAEFSSWPCTSRSSTASFFVTLFAAVELAGVEPARSQLAGERQLLTRT